MGTKPALVLGVNDPVCAQLKDTAVVRRVLYATF